MGNRILPATALKENKELLDIMFANQAPSLSLLGMHKCWPRVWWYLNILPHLLNIRFRDSKLMLEKFMDVDVIYTRYWTSLFANEEVK